MKKQPRLWKDLERHPLSAEYPDIKGPAWQQLMVDLVEHGLVADRRITLYDGKILDGWQLYRACLEANVKPNFMELPEGMTPEKYVQVVNDNRRQETQEVVLVRAAARRDRVAKAREDGQSIREIAEQEDVSTSTIANDLKATGATPANGKVKGKDGKSRPARPTVHPEQLKTSVEPQQEKQPAKPPKPVILCDRCRRTGGTINCSACDALRATKKVKNGAMLFDDSKIEAAIGVIMRSIDDRGRVLSSRAGHSSVMRDRMGEVVDAWKAWQKETT